MTHENLELREFLATRLHGWRVAFRGRPQKEFGRGADISLISDIPAYESTGDGMLANIEAMRARGWAWQGNSTPGESRFRFFREASVTGITQFANDSVNGSLYQFHQHAPMAVALAARAALEGGK